MMIMLLNIIKQINTQSSKVVVLACVRIIMMMHVRFNYIMLHFIVTAAHIQYKKELLTYLLQERHETARLVTVALTRKYFKDLPNNKIKILIAAGNR